MSTPLPDWRVQLRPIQEGTIGGLSVLLVDVVHDDVEDVEVGRVAFVRSESQNPDAAFEMKLSEVVEKAEQAAELLDDCRDDLTRARDMAAADLKVEEQRIIDDAKQKMREVVGLPKTKGKGKKAKMA